MHLDTGFLIDLQREARLGKPGVCHQFLVSQRDRPMRISAPVAMEYLEGFREAETTAAEDFLRIFQFVPVALPEALVASRIRRSLRLAGALIPDADILIAACAIRDNDQLVTDNLEHFGRIEGLRIVRYKS